MTIFSIKERAAMRPLSLNEHRNGQLASEFDDIPLSTHLKGPNGRPYFPWGYNIAGINTWGSSTQYTNYLRFSFSNDTEVSSSRGNFTTCKWFTASSGNNDVIYTNGSNVYTDNSYISRFTVANDTAGASTRATEPVAWNGLGNFLRAYTFNYEYYQGMTCTGGYNCRHSTIFRFDYSNDLTTPATRSNGTNSESYVSCNTTGIFNNDIAVWLHSCYTGSHQWVYHFASDTHFGGSGTKSCGGSYCNHTGGCGQMSYDQSTAYYAGDTSYPYSGLFKYNFANGFINVLCTSQPTTPGGSTCVGSTYGQATPSGSNMYWTQGCNGLCRIKLSPDTYTISNTTSALPNCRAYGSSYP